MGARESQVRGIFLVGILMFGLVVGEGEGLEDVKNSVTVIEQKLQAFSVVIKEVNEDTIKQSDVLKDISELRREVEQLRSEVRQKEENLPNDNNKEVILDWLKESVGDLKEEVRNLEIKEMREVVIGVKEDELDRVKRQVSDVKEDILKLRVDEERSFSRMEEIGQRLDHVSKGGQMALNTIMDLKATGIIHGHDKKKSLKKFGKPMHHKNPKKQHKTLSKKHLQMWMTTADNLHEELYSMMEDSQRKLNKIAQKQSGTSTCTDLQRKIENVAKSAKEQVGIQERKEESDAIIFTSMTSKIDQVEEKLQEIQHQQTLMGRQIETISEDLLLALKNLPKIG